MPTIMEAIQTKELFLLRLKRTTNLRCINLAIYQLHNIDRGTQIHKINLLISIARLLIQEQLLIVMLEDISLAIHRS